jgi:hypothetical protein
VLTGGDEGGEVTERFDVLVGRPRGARRGAAIDLLLATGH